MFRRGSVGSERDRPREKLLSTEQHFKAEAQSPAGLALLLGQLSRPGDTGAHLEHQPVAHDGLAPGNLRTVLSQRHLLFGFAVDEELRGDGAARWKRS